MKRVASDTDLLGRDFGRLHVEAFAGRAADGSGTMWTCLCSCGNRKDIRRKQLTSGDTRSCGCMRSDYQPWRVAYTSDRAVVTVEKHRLAFRLLNALVGEFGMPVMTLAFDQIKQEAGTR